MQVVYKGPDMALKAIARQEELDEVLASTSCQMPGEVLWQDEDFKANAQAQEQNKAKCMQIQG